MSHALETFIPQSRKTLTGFAFSVFSCHNDIAVITETKVEILRDSLLSLAGRQEHARII